MVKLEKLIFTKENGEKIELSPEEALKLHDEIGLMLYKQPETTGYHECHDRYYYTPYRYYYSGYFAFSQPNLSHTLPRE